MRSSDAAKYAVCFFSLATVMAAERAVAEEGVELRAARVCAGLSRLNSNTQGSVKIDNYDFHTDSMHGTVTVSKDGVELGAMEKFSYEKYNDCLFQMIKLLSASK